MGFIDLFFGIVVDEELWAEALKKDGLYQHELERITAHLNPRKTNKLLRRIVDSPTYYYPGKYHSYDDHEW